MAVLRPIPPTPSPPPRYTGEPLPAYRHVPGLTPHPVNHPDGHSHGEPEEALDPESLSLPRDWRECEPYLLGADLFNNAYFWEAHEAWEVVWHAAGHRSVPGLFVQGLIQVSAACLKRHMEVPRGARRLLAKAWRRLVRVEEAMGGEEGGVYMGLALEPWRRRVEEYLGEQPREFPYLRLWGSTA